MAAMVKLWSSLLIVPFAALVVALTEHAAHVFERQPRVGKLGRVDLHADRRLLLAADDTCATPAICEICCARTVVGDSRRPW